MSRIVKYSPVVALCLAATGLDAQQLGRPPHLDGIDTLPAVTLQDNLAAVIRIHRAADGDRVSRAVRESSSKVGYAGFPPRMAVFLDAARADPDSEAGDVLNAIDVIGGKWAGGQSEVAKQYYAATNAYGRAYTTGPVLPGNPRPWQVTPLIRRDPRLGLDYSVGSPAYPSGHTTDSYSQSLLLAMMFPERAQQILARASDYAESRIVLGVHYPLDVIGGRILAISAIVRLLNARSTAFGVAQPRDFAAATRILRAGLDGPRMPYPDMERDRAAYRARLTYGLAPVAATDRPAIVPEGAEVLLATRFPYLDAQQRREVLATTELPSGHALDDGSGYARLDLFAAMGGYGAFRRTVRLRIKAGRAVFSNDIYGPGGLVKLGDGTLALTGRNAFTGRLTIREGRIESDVKALGRGPIRNDATLTLHAPVKSRIDIPITGTGRIVKTGAGTLELTATAAFRGTIAVTRGTVIVRCPSGIRHIIADTASRISDRPCSIGSRP